MSFWPKKSFTHDFLIFEFKELVLKNLKSFFFKKDQERSSSTMMVLTGGACSLRGAL